MGLLEDAIREHLDLKRKHGATDEELVRQEAEALGPARRAMAPAEQADEEVVVDQADGAPAAAGEPPEGEAEALMTEQPEDDVEAVEAEPPTAETPPAPPDETAVYEPPAFADEPGAEPPAFADEPPEPAGEPPPFAEEPPEPAAAEPPAFAEAPPEEAVEETGEHDPLGDTPARGFAPVDDEELAEGGEDDLGDEEDDPDVLEDTPDFLQETPEHDRLWFEQKPPRDFDFD